MIMQNDRANYDSSYNVDHKKGMLNACICITGEAQIFMGTKFH